MHGRVDAWSPVPLASHGPLVGRVDFGGQATSIRGWQGRFRWANGVLEDSWAIKQQNILVEEFHFWKYEQYLLADLRRGDWAVACFAIRSFNSRISPGTHPWTSLKSGDRLWSGTLRGYMDDSKPSGIQCRDMECARGGLWGGCEMARSLRSGNWGSVGQRGG